jgi:glucose-6-phosphate isomerase
MQPETRNNLSALVSLPEWRRLVEHRDGLAGTQLRDLFDADPGRGEALAIEAAGLYLDYAKQRLTADTVELLTALAVARGLPAAIEALFAGEPVNRSEHRAAWHTALRAGDAAPEGVRRSLADVAAFVDAVRDGEWRGFTGEAITDVVNIGIGGSDLGPRLACDALADAGARPKAHFAANVDPAELDDLLAGLSPATTLFVIASKSFATAETLANARATRAWLAAAGVGDQALSRHFVAVTAEPDAAESFGVARIFHLPDWVGGRFSLWSAIGLPLALALGMAVFRELLAGARAMDEHFRRASPARSLPVLLGLIGIWNRNFLGLTGQVTVPYARRLALFPDWQQQVEMESNGKSVTPDGEAVPAATVPQVWGGVGSNAQHAFFQMLHQGTEILPVDFILPLPATADDERERQRVAHCLAQGEALMCGRDEAELRRTLAADGLDGPELARAAAQRRCPGDRPSSTLLLPRVDARSLGALLAAYEHKVYVQGVIWGVNSFDQWGVALGKALAGRIEAELADPRTPGGHDPSTAGLLARVRKALAR